MTMDCLLLSTAISIEIKLGHRKTETINRIMFVLSAPTTTIPFVL